MAAAAGDGATVGGAVEIDDGAAVDASVEATAVEDAVEGRVHPASADRLG